MGDLLDALLLELQERSSQQGRGEIVTVKGVA
jgi:hypothetical protein